ncbi:dTDP-4-dehydrorhamnose reductase [Marinomonas gallaica]|uniref:dTDP-4-dehydrorhamnose reductase n=1 Tax=Marinomonas gallaica TaxID=1806667 RepID=A0A1C3JVR6_9GAMM|nr:dTDP-4-dehydrorhamnose reductase [Marinomonas gallaica]SBT19288.1 dTDP-4-dehydrorhamnose reductase [Marinomonas gallaica]SBT22703.1 dTDP-4-dehydrorhamnose reductase [Marinomonas gallaica]
MRILLTGKHGQLGRCFQDVCAATNHELISYSSDELDIRHAGHVSSAVTTTQPDIIVNAAAYTAVDNAEKESDAAYAVNAQGVEHLARAAQQLGIPIIHVSTDYVFDGAGVEPYKPSDLTRPCTVYGASKLAGEQALAEHCTKYMVLRTAWVFSEYGNNFVKTMLRLAQDRDALSVVADQYGCPTYAGDLARAILILCNHYQQTHELAWGVHHYCGDLPTSWHGFARTIFGKSRELGLLKTTPQLTAISSEQYPTPAERPEYSVLECLTLSELGVRPGNWHESLSHCLKKMKDPVVY